MFPHLNVEGGCDEIESKQIIRLNVESTYLIIFIVNSLLK